MDVELTAKFKMHVFYQFHNLWRCSTLFEIGVTLLVIPVWEALTYGTCQQSRCEMRILQNL